MCEKTGGLETARMIEEALDCAARHVLRTAHRRRAQADEKVEEEEPEMQKTV